MFAPETEDMLPRAAPKPSASVPTGHTEEVVKPTVPEVSILFGQMIPESQQQPEQQIQTQPQQERLAPTFASWKKQMLPRVTFPSVLATELGPSTASSISSNSSNGSEYNTTQHSRARTYATNAQTQVHPLISNPIVNYGDPLGHYQREMYSGLSQRRSLDETTIVPRKTVPVPMGIPVEDVLTICAGTQTEDVNISPKGDKLPSIKMSDFGNLASKDDFKEILNLLKFVYQEQQQLRYLCESFSQQQQSKNSTTSKDIGTQCEILSASVNDTPVKRLMQDNITEEADHRPSSPVTYNPIRALPQFNSPRVQPIAQSTAYRANTPQGKHAATPPSNLPMIATVLPKANTEKSLVMNELALKYLPQQHLNELMHEMHLSPTHKEKGPNNESPKILGTAPLRQIDNLNQSPNDISNASYKYLKKYRLLPEEQMEHQFQSPITMRKQQQRIGSPLTIQSPQQEQPMIDLENIRNQPKLL